MTGRKRQGGQPPRARAKNPGLPDPSSVVSEKTFTSPAGKRYRILKTTETDPYDPPARKPRERA